MDHHKISIEIGDKRRTTEWPLTVDRRDAIGVITPKGWVLSVSRDRNKGSRVMITPKGRIAFAESDINLETDLVEEMQFLMGTLIARYVRDAVLGDPEAEVVVDVFGAMFSAM